MTQPRTPADRIAKKNDKPVRGDGAFVLYWMIAARRTRMNFALDRAVEYAIELRKPLVVFEPLRCGYRYASDRLHRFILDGMADNESALANTSAFYYPYVEPAAGAGKGLLTALSKDACVVVTDDYPAFFLPRMVEAAAKKLPVLLEAIDSNGILPLNVSETRQFTVAHSFRRHLQKTLPDHLMDRPREDPLAGARLPHLKAIDDEIRRRWPPAHLAALRDPSGLARLPIDHTVPVVADLAGGSSAARKRLDAFVPDGLARYGEDRNHPDRDATSGLSPYLHFGHVSAHEVLWRILEAEDWSPESLAEKPNGKVRGWWGLCAAAAEFVDQLVTWREIGFNGARTIPGFDTGLSALPAWAQTTLNDHAGDRREVVYSIEQFESAETHDELWNAAQRQLLTKGRIHNYLRMVWGKKILEWTDSPAAALDAMLYLNDKYALDGRDPNSYSGIFWCLGRYDRAWGPERPVFGKVRYMTTANTRRKVECKEYLRRFGSR